MKALGGWVVAGVVVGFVACTQSYDDFDFSGTTPTAGTGGSTTTTGVGGSAGSTTTQSGTGGTGTPSGTGGTGTPSGTGGTGGGGTGGAAGTGGTGGAISCTDQYDHPNIYELCVERADECEFRARTNNGEQCDDICQAGGGECLAFYNDINNQCGGHGTEYTCTTPFNSGLCVCSRGCGTGPPCVPPAVCSGGNCN